MKVDGYICDVVGKSGKIYEIQTALLSKLTEKLENLLKNHDVSLVYPLAEVTYIETVDENGNILSKRKSPKTKDIYSIFEELYKLYRLFEFDNFELIVIPVVIKKTKEKLNEKVQSKQNSRHHLRDYVYIDKSLISQKEEIVFSSKNDFLKLMSKELPEIFSSRELRKTKVKNNANKMLWVLLRMNLIEIDHKEGNLIYYRKK